MKIIKILLLIFIVYNITIPEPIVITGKMLPSFIGEKISSIRVVNSLGKSIPYQIDEVEDNEYVCSYGDEPNKGNGILDTADEIVFLWEDADSVVTNFVNEIPLKENYKKLTQVTITNKLEKRCIYFISDSSIPLSKVKYIEYDSKNEIIYTPYYYAKFEPKRFHFVRAGIREQQNGMKEYSDITNELRIKIFLKALWGLLPITYTEQNIVCYVKRFKAGPIRLIRRGDFHLNLGLFLQGSHAAVNQICYPQIVRVPVYVHLPVRFKNLFKEAYIEMSPVMLNNAYNFKFEVPSYNLLFPFSSSKKIDTLVKKMPNLTCMTVHNNVSGFGWFLDATIDTSKIDGSGYCIQIPSERKSLAHAGFRLAINDLPKGYYLIGVWFVFSLNGINDLYNACEQVSDLSIINVEGSKNKYYNQIIKIMPFKKR
jgi:hypothetical protein